MQMDTKLNKTPRTKGINGWRICFPEKKKIYPIGVPEGRNSGKLIKSQAN
jgi:hypothetical protein